MPKLELNETEIEMWTGLTPSSYYTIDWEEPDANTRHPGLMVAHAVFMSTAFFGALPIGIALRSVKHPAHPVAVFSFYALCVLGWASGALYTKMTPNMWHGSLGWVVLFFAATLTAIDIFAGIHRCIAYLRSGDKFNLKTFWQTVVLNKRMALGGLDAEYTSLVQEPEEYEDKQAANNTNERIRHHRRSSEGTVFDAESATSSMDALNNIKSRAHDSSSEGTRLALIGNIAFATAERVLVFAGFALVLSGIVVYTGGCRGDRINICLAHLIKGGIFWCYGLLTFARFLGSFAEFGWAWNKSPSANAYSAEFVESLVIFTYGASNTWMERFGAKAGDPYTTKQIQHISIAVMFWFAGLIGMGIESRRIRKWLASSTTTSIDRSRLHKEASVEPPSYTGSFNPFPALVIGVTGAAMAAHAQAYVFEVQIHQLWGNLLVAFSVLRCFTYFFLWVAPPKSVLPSRPPTEALGSFFLACGGLVFMLSTEEVSIAAMRRGRDDVMMFLNVAVAMTCFAFCWTICMVGFKGWLKARAKLAPAHRIIA
ncbi:hypothetical protein M378DRAFT_1063721 [Amanita muscaria Koide BX008]|uniref:Integral membrane protein n=1 Tax=Amanita muscaria (strain Koide BX008) TaxID=946122 RepID=A0A0C2X202_AMAMK|nr:hypothetical protein M378DRAFT_1063721 [Amanita muscaria Koide BX008]